MNRALALTRFHGAVVANGPRTGGAWDAVYGAPPISDEAEQCRVLLMNEGELLYRGEPKALTQTCAVVAF